jgi:hypothetical protein
VSVVGGATTPQDRGGQGGSRPDDYSAVGEDGEVVEP